MPMPTLLSTAVFCALVFLVAAFVAVAFYRATRSIDPAVTILMSHLVIPAVLAEKGVLDRYDPLPAPALLLVLALTLLTIAIVSTTWGAALAARVSLGAIMTLQAFRIGVEWWLHRMYEAGIVPVQMTYAGRNFDIVTGITGLVLGLWLLRGGAVHRRVVWLWNIMGLLLLANIVAVAVLSTPVPFRKFVEGPPNLLPSIFPYVWLPSFLVQVALGSHLLVFRQLRRKHAI